MKYIFLTLFIVLTSLDLTAQDDVEILMDQVVYGSKGKKIISELSTTIWLTETKMKISSDEMRQPILIFDSEKEEISMIFRDRKEYVQINKAELQEINAKLEEAKSIMESRLSMLPEAQRKMMETQMQDMYGGNEAPEVSYNETKNGVKVGPYSSSLISGKTEGQLVEEIYIASIDQFEISLNDFEIFHKMGEFMEENMSSLMSTTGESGSMGFVTKNNPSFKDGVPVKTVNYDLGIKKSEEVLQKISRIDIPTDAFEITPGYKKIDFTQQMKSER